MDHDGGAPETRLTADQRIYNLGYGAGKAAGYNEGHTDGVLEGEEATATWLRVALALLVQDVRLGLRHDLTTPLDVLAAVRAVVDEGKPDWAEDEAEAQAGP